MIHLRDILVTKLNARNTEHGREESYLIKIVLHFLHLMYFLYRPLNASTFCHKQIFIVETKFYKIMLQNYF